MYGYTKNAIVYDTTIKNWIIVDDQNKMNYTVLGIYVPKTLTSTVPTGEGQWRLFDPNCNQTRLLSISSVTTNYNISLLYNP